LGVKDIFDVRGYPTGCGQPTQLALSGIKTQTAPLVQQLLDQGACWVGKTHTVELTYCMTGKNIHFGTPINPAAPDRLPGGSSSGSASAVAAGLCEIGLGSDTGGSIRAPASYCGLYGIRPTHGRLSLEGAMPLAPSFDTPGWMTRDLDTLIQVAKAVFLPDSRPWNSKMRWVVAEEHLACLEPGVRAQFLAQLEYLEITSTSSRFIRLWDTAFETLAEAFRTIQGYEAWKVHGPFIETYRPTLDRAIEERFKLGQNITLEALEAARCIQQAFKTRLADLFDEGIALMLPTTPGPAPYRNASDSTLAEHRSKAIHLMLTSGLSGCPQITLPLLRHAEAPLGLSILGPPHTDLALCEQARAILQHSGCA
jgi:amidase